MTMLVRTARTVDGAHQSRADGDSREVRALADGDRDGEAQQGGAHGLDGQFLLQRWHIIYIFIQRGAFPWLASMSRCSMLCSHA